LTWHKGQALEANENAYIFAVFPFFLLNTFQAHSYFGQQQQQQGGNVGRRGGKMENHLPIFN